MEKWFLKRFYPKNDEEYDQHKKIFEMLEKDLKNHKVMYSLNDKDNKQFERWYIEYQADFRLILSGREGILELGGFDFIPMLGVPEELIDLAKKYNLPEYE